MPKAIRHYVRLVDRTNEAVGLVAMYSVFLIVGILLYSSVMKAVSIPPLWTLEMAQFAMVAYYILGGPYSIQLGSNVRMDLVYARWSAQKKAWVDAITIFFLIFYLAILLYGGLNSTIYAIEYGERSYSAWRPYMWPIKVIMCFGILMMLLQALAEFCKDIALIRGKTL